MTKKWIAINLLLLVFTGLLGWQVRISILRFNAENDPAKIQPARDLKKDLMQEKALPGLPQAKIYLPPDFAVIPEKNLFADSRSKEVPEPVSLPPEIPPLVQKPILIGVTIVDNQRKALIIDPQAPAQDKNRRIKAQRIGDVYQGYTITGIELDRIILESGTRKETIPLREGSKRAQAGKTPILSTRVVSFGGGISGGAPVAAGGSTTLRSGTMPVTASGQQGTAQSSPTQVRQTPPSNIQQQVQPAAQPSTQEAPPGMRIIRTPFGNVTRPKRE
jgi:hypothetical protein